MEDETIIILTSADEYAHHIGHVASVSTKSLKVIRKQLSLKTPYVLEVIQLSDVVRAEYKTGLAAFRIIAGVLLLTLLAGIAYYLGVYWASLPLGTKIQVGLLALAGAYGLRWAFMSRRHTFIFYLQNDKKILWHSRSGDFKYKERAASILIEFLQKVGLMAKTTPQLTSAS